jgi:hypothetical protein
MLKIPMEYDKDNSQAELTDILTKFLPASLPGVSAGYCHKALVDVSGLTGTQMGMHNIRKLLRCMGCFVIYHLITVTSKQ